MNTWSGASTTGYNYRQHLFFCLRLGWISLVMYAGSLALSQMSGYGIVEVIWLMGLASTIYACFGGLKAVVWTDVVQAIMLFGGAFAVLGYVMVTTDTGLVDWWETLRGQHKASIPLISFDPFVRHTIVTVIIDRFSWNVCTHGSDQVVLQRYFATPSGGTALRCFVVTLVSQISMALLLTASGLALLYFSEIQQVTAKMRAGYAHRRETVLRIARELESDKVLVTPPQGAFYFFLDLRPLKMTSLEICERILEEAGVGLVPGSAFGEQGEGFARLCIAASDEDVENGFRKIVEWAERQ